MALYLYACEERQNCPMRVILTAPKHHVRSHHQESTSCGEQVPLAGYGMWHVLQTVPQSTQHHQTGVIAGSCTGGC